MMDKGRKIRINIFICLIILAGFAAIGVTSYVSYSNNIKDDIKNISKLTATNIYSDIRNELTKPIYVALTMANDNFLKNWLKGENNGNDSAGHQQELQKYLMGIKEKYGYDSVFMISDASKKYYYFQGLNKVISPGDQHDQWYYTFLGQNVPYALVVDTDEVNHNRLSVFINCRITDEDGTLMGVTGVGLEINEVRNLLKSFENEFQLEAMLFSSDGTVQVQTDTDEIEKENVFDLPAMKGSRDQIVNDLTSLEVFQYKGKPSDGYVITRYIDDMDWYLLIKKDTSVLERSFYSDLIRVFILFAAVVLSVLFVVNRLITEKEMALTSMARIDSLTNLPNRRGFNEQLEKVISGISHHGPFHVFVFDVDNFKKVNDNNGHMIGDMILRRIGQIASEAFSKNGFISRWGGDEFAGFLFGNGQEVAEEIEQFFSRIHGDRELQLYNTALSMGVVASHNIDTADTLIYRADKALYEAKENGKDRCVWGAGTNQP